MEIEIKNKKENPQLQRNEIEGEISFTGATPSNKQLQEELAKKTGAKPELIVIRHIYGAFGKHKARFEAAAYATKEQFDKIEPKKKEAAPAPGAPAPAPAAPAPKEEKKEAPKAEAKEEAKKEAPAEAK